MELKVGKLNMSNINKNEISGYISEINKLKQTYITLMTQLNSGTNVNFSSLTSSIDNAKTKISELSAKVDDAKTKLASDIKLKIDNRTLNNQLSVVESKFKKLGTESNEVSSQIQKLKSLLGNMDASDDIESVISDYNNFQQTLKSTENQVKGLQRVQSEQINTVNKTTTAFSSLTKQVASYFSAYQMINYSIRAMKDMCQNVLDVDTAMTELYRITDLTSEQYDKLYSKMTSSAKEYGSSLAEIINSTADWVRLGFDSNNALRLSEITTMYQHVTDLDNTTAVDNLVTAYKGFQDQLLELTNNDEAAAIELIADIYDKLGNEFALSAANVGSGLSKAASTLQMAGNSIQESAAMLTGITEVTQDPDKAGNALKILSLRLRGMKGDLEALGEDVDENVESLSKMQTQVLNLSHGRVNIFKDDGSFKSTYEIMDNIAEIYYDLTDTNRADLLETIAGKNRANDVASLISNWENVEKALVAATNAEGTAAEEQEKWIQSLQGHLEQLGAAWESLSNNFLSSGFLKGLVDGLTSLVNIIDVVMDKFGVMPVLIGAISMALSFKGIGFVKLNADADGFLNRLTLMNTSLGTIRRSIATMFSNLSNAFKTGGLKGGFSAIGSGIKSGAGNMLANMLVPQKDLAAIKAYNAEFDRLSEKVNQSGVSVSKYTIAQKAANNTMKDASTSANAIVKSANGGKVAIEGLGASMLVAKAKMIALQVATTALNMAISMGLSIAISAIVSAITSWINKEEEAKEAALEAGESARKEAKDIIELYNAYNQADTAYKNNTGSKEQLESATQALLEALGVEQSELEGLIEKYGSLEDAIKGVTNESLKKKLSDLTSGYKAAKEDLLDKVEDGWFSSFSLVDFSHSKKNGTTKFADVLRDAGLISQGSYGSAGGSIYIGDNTTIEGVIEIYDNLQKMKETLEEKIGESYTREELSESNLYNSITDKISFFSEEYENLLGYIEDINKTASQLEYNDYVSKNGIPETREEYETLRDTLVKTAKSSDDFVGSQEQIENSVIDALSDIPELTDCINAYNNSLEQTEEAAVGIQYVTEALDALSEKSVSATSSISKLNEVLNTQAIGTSISLEDFNSEELADYQSALEYVNGSMQINADKAREIARAKVEEQTATNNVNKELRQAQYMQNISQIEALNREIKTNINLTKEEKQERLNNILSLEAENAGYLAECDQLDVLNASLRESISAYNEWKAAQNASESGDMFDDTLTAIKAINDTLNDTESDIYGRVGRKNFEASVDLIIPDSVNSEDEQAINNYLDSIRNLFTFNKDGDINGLNIEEFCQEAVDKGLMVLDKASDSYQVAGGKTMSDFAKGMNLSMPLVQAMFGELEEFGAEFDWGDEMFSTFGDGIVAAQKEISNLEAEIKDLKKQKKAGIDIDSSQIDEAKAKLEELKQKKAELIEKSYSNIKKNINIDSEISNIITKLNLARDAKKIINKKEDKNDQDIKNIEDYTSKIKILKGQLEEAQKKKDKLQEPTQVEIQAVIGSIDEQIANLQEQLEIFSDKQKRDEYALEMGIVITDEMAEQAISDIQSQIDKLDKKKAKIEPMVETDLVNKKLNAIDKIEIEDKKFNVSAIDKATEIIENINNALDNLDGREVKTTIVTHEKSIFDNVKDKVVNAVNSIRGKNKVSGTAHVFGTAKASGDWGNKETGKTLVGELGREIVVNPHTGKWYTVGDNGAEFVNIPKNAIVFNHLQTENLLSKGFVASRALALASGTVSGDAMVTGGIKRTQVIASSNRKNHYSSDSKYAKKKKSDEKKNKKKGKSILEKFQDWVSKFFDWIEIKIKRQTEKIDKYVSKAENAKDAGNYGTSVKNYRKAINATTTQITNKQEAAKKYNNQANKVVNKAVSMGVVSKEQANNIKKQVQNGSLDITKYGKKVQEVIKDYQEWYEKSKDASNAIKELHNNIRTYIQDLKDIRDTQRDAKLDKIDTYTSIGISGYASTTHAQNSQLSYSNSQLNKQDKAYDTEVSEVNKDVKKIGKTGTNAVNKALKSKDAKGKSKKSKAYKKALNNAKKAIKTKKAVSSADLKTIKSHSISVYNKLYAYNLSLDNLEIAKLEQATNVAATSAERFENTSKKYENKDNKTNDKISLLRLKSDNATSVKSKNSKLDKVASQYDKIVEDDKSEIKEYKKEQKSSQKTIKNKAGTGSKFKNLNKKNKKNVKSYITKAKNAAKSGKSIDANVISKLAEFYSKGYVSKSFYEACINYNNAIEHREEAEAQLEIDKQTAIQEKAAIGTEKFNNVEQKYTNKQNTTKSAKNKESINQSIKSTKGHLLSVSDYQTMLNYSKQEQQIYTDEIVALNKTIQENLSSGYWTTASQEYIDAMNSVSGYEEEVLNCQQEQEELNNEIAQLPYTIFDKAIGLIQSIKSNFQSLLSIKTTRGVSKTNSDILTEISNVNTELAKQTERRNKLWEDYQTAVNSGGAYGGKDSDEWLTEFYDADTEVNNLKADVESLNNEIAQLPYETYEKALELLDSIASYNKSIADLTKAQGRDLSAGNYLQQISDNNAKIQKYESERIQAYSDYMKALASYDGAYGGMTSDEWLGRYNDLGTTINGLKVDNEDIRDAMRDDVYWRTFERSHKAAQALKDILSGIADLIDDDMLYDKNGNFTDYGVAQMANIVKQFETARKEVQNYTNDIQNLNSLYAQGFYNQDEFNEKLNELQNGLFDSASAMKSYISEIIDMNKKLAQSELDALLKLIDARNDALTAKKNYYDYDKTIKDKTKDIQALKAQIGALEGVETAEAKAQKARLEADLADKKDDLNDTIMNHSFELSKDALDELKTILQDEFDERWDNIGQDLNEIQKLIAAANELTSAQSHIVGSALNKLLSFYGINPTSTDLNQFGNVTGYASGTRKVDRDKVAWTQENGQEVIVRKSDGAILTPLSRGDSVIPNNLTNNLFDWGMYNPQEFADSLVRGIPDIPKAQPPVTTVEQHYDSLLNVEGNVDSTVVTDLEKFAKTFYQGAYKYTVNEITKDARRNGIKA